MLKSLEVAGAVELTKAENKLWESVMEGLATAGIHCFHWETL